MTLYELVVDGGFVSSLALLTLLVLMWPARRHRPVLCLEARPDEHGTHTHHLMRDLAAAVGRSFLALPVMIGDRLDELVGGGCRLLSLG